MLPVLRILFWSSAAVTVLASLLGALFSYSRDMADIASVLTRVSLVCCWAIVILGPIVSSKTKRERRARYERVYPTREALLHALDGEAIRSVRDSKSSVHAVRALRRQLPGVEVPREDALAVVRSL